MLICSAHLALADTPDELLIVELRFNGESYGTAIVLTDAEGEFYVERRWLDLWEIVTPPPPARQFRGRDFFAISAFDGATVILQPRDLVLNVQVPPRHLPTRVVNMRGGMDLKPEASFGAFMDYDWTYRDQDSGTVRTFSSLLRPVVFGSDGNVAANLLFRDASARRGATLPPDGDGMTVLDLTYTRDDPANVRSLRVGDIISRPGSLGRALRLGGVQFATNFATRPTMVTHPLPNFYGQTAVPTALDIYINGQLFRRQDVAPGAFILEDIPVVNGSGQMEIVTEDALGRRQSIVQDFYGSTALLRQGLNDYSFTLGALREDYGIKSFSYGDLAGSATWRHGLRNDLTLEGHLEFGSHLGVVTGATKFKPLAGGIIDLGLGLSNGSDGTGVQWLAGFQRSANLFSYNVRVTGTTRKFALVGIIDPLPAVEFFTSGSINAPIRGTLGAAFTHQDYRDREDRSIASLNYSTTIGRRLSVSAVASYVDAGTHDLTVGVRVSMPFGDNHFASGGLSIRESDTQVQVETRRNLPLGPGWGYHLAVSRAGETSLDAGVVAQNDFGTYSANYREFGSSTEWQLGSSGSVATMGGMTHVTRQIREAFAVVDVGDYEGVRVYSENREIGRTNENGQIFVPGLRPYQRNQISIEVDDLPLSAQVGDLRQDASPYLRSGIVVEFEVLEAHDAIIHVVLPDGSPVRQGAVARVFEQRDWSPVGSDGRVYLQGLTKPSQVTVRWNGSVCDFIVPKPQSGTMIPNLGKFTCEPRKFE